MFSGPESSTVPAFVAKLWQMVCDPKYDALISWCDNGSSFVIKDQLRFCAELLPMYYKHNNMASFIRQLNKYGFRKVVSVNSASLKGDMSDFEFCHPHFIRGCPLLLEQIKRKVSISKDISEYRSDQGLLTKLLLQVQQMQQKQSSFETRITSMKAENDALWREHSILRQKHQKQQKIVNRLIQFLLSLVHQTRGVNVKRRNMPLMLKDGTCLPIEGLAPIKQRYGSSSPVICEIDPNDILKETKNQNPTFSNESNINIIIPDQKEVNSGVMKNKNDILLEIPSSSTIAIPLQEVTSSVVLKPNVQTEPKIVSKKSLSLNGYVNKTAEKRSVGLSNDKRLTKVRKISPNPQIANIKTSTATSNTGSRLLSSNAKITSKKIVNPTILSRSVTSKSNPKSPYKISLKTNRDGNTITLKHIELLKNDSEDDKLFQSGLQDPVQLENPLDLGSDIPFQDDSQDPLHLEDPLKLESDIPVVNIFNDNMDFTLEDQSSLLTSDPVVFSPSGTQILSPNAETPLRDENTNTSLVISDSNSQLNNQDVESHIDLMQSDIDALKEILHGEGLSLDASTIMGLFGNEDPLSLNMPEAGKKNSSNFNTSTVGNELVTYNSPGIIDFADGLDDDDDLPTASDLSFIDDIPSTLNTPQSTLKLDFPSSSKNLKK